MIKATLYVGKSSFQKQLTELTAAGNIDEKVVNLTTELPGKYQPYLEDGYWFQPIGRYCLILPESFFRPSNRRFFNKAFKTYDAFLKPIRHVQIKVNYEMKRTNSGGSIAMCASRKEVRDWVSNSLTYVFKNVPGLGGVFTITASENSTSCASHGNQKGYPRCSKRDYSDIIAEINTAIEAEVHKGNPDANLMMAKRFNLNFEEFGLEGMTQAILDEAVLT